MARKRAKEPEQLGPAMTDAERAELDERLARMFSKPNRGDLGVGGFFLLWMQRDESGSARMMMWRPETDAEIRAANLFYDAAHGLGEFARRVKPGRPLRRSREHDAFIKAILQNRGDDTGYLAYADYLTEHGNSQGDFIRACVELNRLPPDSPERAEKNQRVNELIAAHAEEWYGPLGELGLKPVFFGTYLPLLWLSLERGVIEEVNIDVPDILPKSAARLFAAAPFLRKLAFEKGHLDPAGLAKVKQLAQIDELDLGRTDLTAEGLRAVLRSRYLTGLKSLNLGGNTLGDAGAAVLAAWPGLAQLESLDVSSCALSADGIRATVGSPHVKNLLRLRIGRNPDHTGSVEAVLSARNLKKLTELELGEAEFLPDSAGLFRTAAFAGTLQNLELEMATFQPDSFAAFARCPLPALRRLSLSMARLRTSDCTALAGAVWRGALTELALESCLGLAGVEEFVRGKFPSLKTLNLARNRLGNRGGAALVGAAKNFPALTTLRLLETNLGAEAIGQLAESKLFANLTELDISGNKIGPKGATAMAKSKYLRKLETLAVDEKTIGKKGKKALLDHFGEGVMSFR